MLKNSLVMLTFALLAHGANAQTYKPTKVDKVKETSPKKWADKPYIQISGGVSASPTNWPTNVQSTSHNSSGSKLVVGLKASTELSLEVGYYDFGKVKATYEINKEATHSTNGIIANVIWAGSHDRWLYKAGLGISLLKTQIANIPSDISNQSFYSSGMTTSMPSFTLGVGYQLTPHIVLVGDIDVATSKYFINPGTTQKTTHSLISIGMRANF